MTPPLKLRHGDTLATLYDRFNAVIDYLTRTRIVAGSGIRVSQLPAGQTIESTATAAGGTAAAPAASGMFRVAENADGTVSVSGGYVQTSISPYEGPAKIDGTTLQRESGKNYVIISIAGNSRFFELVTDINLAYVPGEKIVWPIAVLSTQSTPFVQLWQGGMIDFTTKYLVG